MVAPTRHQLLYTPEINSKTGIVATKEKYILDKIYIPRIYSNTNGCNGKHSGGKKPTDVFVFRRIKKTPQE